VTCRMFHVERFKLRDSEASGLPDYPGGWGIAAASESTLSPDIFRRIYASHGSSLADSVQLGGVRVSVG